MKHGHGGAQTLVLALIIGLIGLGVFLFIPQSTPVAGLAGIAVVLLILKHIGLLAAVGGGGTAALKAVRRKHGGGGQE